MKPIQLVNKYKLQDRGQLVETVDQFSSFLSSEAIGVRCLENHRCCLYTIIYSDQTVKEIRTSYKCMKTHWKIKRVIQNWRDDK